MLIEYIYVYQDVIYKGLGTCGIAHVIEFLLYTKSSRIIFRSMEKIMVNTLFYLLLKYFGR